ncbi:MAG: TatD family hydrolase [Opitutales bacterium]|nr:TatD family hydrolase [Opitutales bacterium]
MIDCHCHLDTFVRSGEIEEIIARAESSGVNALVVAGTNSSDWKVYRQLAEAFPQKVFYTAGLHPTEVGDDFEVQLAELESFFEKSPRAVAVGEIGLDGHWLPKDPEDAKRVFARQREAFSRQLALAKQLELPVVVHARDAFRETVEMIDASGVDWRRVDFHCFAEDAAQISEINARGGRASFTGTLTYKSAENVRRAALAQGLDRLMLETDCPYLAPLKLRGKRNEPAFMRHTAEFAAELFGVPAEVLFRKTEENTREFFGI